MARQVGPSNLTDLFAIGGAPYPEPAREPGRVSEGWTTGVSVNALYGVFQDDMGVFASLPGSLNGDFNQGVGYASTGEYAVAPEGVTYPGMTTPGIMMAHPSSSQTYAPGHARTGSLGNGLSQTHQTTYATLAHSPSAASDHSSPFMSTSSSDMSDSGYPTPGPQAHTTLAPNFVAEPLDSSSTSMYTDYFSGTSESLCLFADIGAQFYQSPISTTSSSSPGPSPENTVAPQVVPNYSGPIRNQIVNMYTDEHGVVWIVFPYSKNKEVKNHTIRCDVDKVPPSALRPDIKTVSAAAYPMVGGIILGELDFKKYTGKRFAYEWDCCWLGWSLAQLNPTLLEQKGLLQRATDNVASFVFQGCMSRTKLKSYRTEKNKSRDNQLPLHDWEKHMLPRPNWLPGLDQDKSEKTRLKKLFELTEAEYQKYIAKGNQKDAATMKKASEEAIKFYHLRVNRGETVTPTMDKVKVKEVERKPESTMNYINIPADPHVESRDAQQIRINVLLDRVRENVINDAIRHDGMVFIDVFDTSGIADSDLKAKIDRKKEMVVYYRKNEIGLVKPTDENLESLEDLISVCGLDMKEYEKHWQNFKLEMNNLGFKIKYLDTNNRHQKITDPLLMQRVLHEILRRSYDNTDRYSKKRKAENKLPRHDGMFAEDSFNRESRGARPGMTGWVNNVKRRRTDSVDTRMYKNV